MTGFRGWSEAVGTVEPLTPETLRELLLTAREFVAVDNPSRGAAHQARATRVSAEFWAVQIGAAAEARRNERVNTDAAFDILRSWAAGDDWWAEAFTWQPA